MFGELTFIFCFGIIYMSIWGVEVKSVFLELVKILLQITNIFTKGVKTWQ